MVIFLVLTTYFPRHDDSAEIDQSCLIVFYVDGYIALLLMINDDFH